jgi:hypothetical protein
MLLQVILLSPIQLESYSWADWVLARNSYMAHAEPVKAIGVRYPVTVGKNPAYRCFIKWVLNF